MSCLGLVAAAAAGYAFGLASDRLAAQAPISQKPPANKGWVAMIYGQVPVTREDLGEFLIARGGYEKLELLVNKRIIEVEAAHRQITVTDVEVRAGLEEDLRGLDMKMADFTKHVLPRYGKSLYEWTEDVIKPRILLSKMCRADVKVTQDDLKRLFENKHGEKRQAKLICWSKDDLEDRSEAMGRSAQGEVEFDSRRASKPTRDSLPRPGSPHRSAATPTTTPTARSLGRKVLFNLKEGEISQLFHSRPGSCASSA